MKLVAILRDGQRVPLDGPFELVAHDADDNPVVRRTVSISIEKGSGTTARSSNGSVSVASGSGGYSVRVDVKP